MRHVLRRFLAAFSAVWIVVALVEPPGLYVCPMHSAASVAPTAPSSGDAAHAHHQGADNAAPEDANHHGDDCRCIADCLGVGSAVVASVAQVHADSLAAIVTHIAAADVDAPLGNPGLLLPFANAPPVQS